MQKKTVLTALFASSLLFSCSIPKRHILERDFPPRVDHYLEEEFVDRPGYFVDGLNQLKNQEVKAANNFPDAFVDLITWLIGV